MTLRDHAIDPSEIKGDTLSLKFVPLSVLSKLDEVLLRENHKKHDIGGLWQSIKRYGFVNPAKFDSNLNGGKGGLVFGNGRTEAIVGMLVEAHQQGGKPPRGIATDTSGEWCVPILFGVDQASEMLARSLAIDDNNFVMAGGDFTAWDMAKMWDVPEYVGLLKELAEEEVMAITVDEDGLASLLLGLAGDGDRPEETEEDLEELEEAIGDDDYVGRVKPGEIWKLGRHLVLAGDSTIEANVRALLGDQIGGVGMVWSDPPYGISHSGKGIKGDINGNDFGEILNDEDVVIAKDSFNLCKALFGNAKQIFWGANYYPSALTDGYGWIVWDKEREGETFIGAELAFVNKGVRLDVFRHQWHGMIKASEHGQKRVHPTQKPVKLFTWCVERYALDANIIFDPFLGSGISIIGCEELGEDYAVYGCELSLAYCEVVIKRWEKLTGETAEKVGELP